MALAELPFVLPDFLEESEEEIHERMLKLGSKYDTSEASLFWDLTIPTALEKARMIEFTLPHFLMIMFPQFAEDIFLDYHAVAVGVERRPAIPAIGEVTITGAEGTFIPADTILSTAAIEGEIVEYRTIENATIGESGSVSISIEAIEAGRIGNVPAHTITNILEPITGIELITNENPATGGVDREDDETFRARILDRNRNKALSGSKSDYERWAKEVPGVGEVVVVPEWNGPGTVKVMITDAIGGYASAELVAAVQNHIAPDGKQGGALAPIGATVTVGTVAPKMINLSFSIEIDPTYNAEEVLNDFKEAVIQYFGELSIGGLIRYSRIGALLIETQGVKDYSNLTINGSTDNIQLTNEEIAALGEVTAT